MDLKWIETVVKQEQREKRIIHIVRVESEGGVTKGDNYLSHINRLKITVLLGSGRQASIALILKSKPKLELLKSLVDQKGVFKQEVLIFTTILKEMENLMAEFGDRREKLWSDFIAFQAYDEILFHDLTAEGYRVEDRTKFLHLQHGYLVMDGLGRFHAMSKILLDRGIIAPSDLNPFWVIDDETSFDNLWGRSLLYLGNTMQKWGKKWVPMGKKLIESTKGMYKKIYELYKVDGKRFNVMNHGDTWTTNMLFHYKDPSEPKPDGVKFIDFQVSYYNSPIWDLMYFMCTSLDPSVRRENLGFLLEKYLKSLNSCLDFYKYEGPRLDIATLKSELKRTELVQIPLLFVYFVIMTSDLNNAYDFEIEKKSGPNKELLINPKIYEGERGEKFRKAMGPDLIYFLG